MSPQLTASASGSSPAHGLGPGGRLTAAVLWTDEQASRRRRFRLPLDQDSVGDHAGDYRTHHDAASAIAQDLDVAVSSRSMTARAALRKPSAYGSGKSPR